MTEVSFIGLGSMGGAMVHRLIESGIKVNVWNRSPEAIEEFEALGATRLASVVDAFNHNLVFSMLSNDAAALAQFSTENLAAAKKGTIHVNMASVSVAAADELEARHKAAGIDYVAAPVMGRPPVALAGQLNIVFGGTQGQLDRVASVLDVMGKKTWVVSDKPRVANLVKIAVNFNLIHALEALGESIALVESGGVDGNTLVALLTDTAFSGSAYGGYGPMIANKKYFPAGFNVALGKKDLNLVADAADEAGLTLPTLATLKDVFDQALATPEIAEGDWSAIAEISRRRK